MGADLLKIKVLFTFIFYSYSLEAMNLWRNNRSYYAWLMVFLWIIIDSWSGFLAKDLHHCYVIQTFLGWSFWGLFWSIYSVHFLWSWTGFIPEVLDNWCLSCEIFFSPLGYALVSFDGMNCSHDFWLICVFSTPF